MRFVTVKRANEIKLEGIKVSLDVVNSCNKGVVLTDAKGNIVRIRIDSYNLAVEVLAPPELEKKHKLTGTVLGIPVDKTFDDEYEAKSEKMKLEDAAPTAELKVEEIQVPADPSSDDICPF